MSEIKVILDTSSTTKLEDLSPEERELFFEQLGDDNPTIPRIFIDGFKDMQNKIIQDDTRSTKPNLKELILRKIIQMGNYGNVMNTLVVPIVANFSNLRSQIKTGGKFHPLRRVQAVETKIVDAHAIRVRFDTRILVTTDQGLDYIVPSNEETNIIGIVFNPICAIPNALSRGGQLRPIKALKIGSSSVADRIVMGNYSTSEAASSCDDYFIKPIYATDIARKTMFSGMDDKALMQLFGQIFDYISNMESYYHSIIAAQFIKTQTLIAVKNNPVNVPAISASLHKLITSAFMQHVVADGSVGKERPRPEILNILETIHHGRFNNINDMVLLAAIELRGFSNIYNEALLKGKDSPGVLAKIKVHSAQRARILFQKAEHEKVLDEKNKLGAYRTIIEKKYGAKRLLEIDKAILSKPSKMSTAKNILNLLNPNERKPVEAEFDRRVKYLAAFVNNKCPHVPILSKFRLSKTDVRTREFYGELTKFFKNPTDANNYIICNNCGFDVICPHVRDLTAMGFANKPYIEIKATLTKYIDNTSGKGSLHCKICGEIISSPLDEVGVARDTTQMMDEELKNFMWGEMAILMKYVKFGNLVDVRQLITLMRNACYQYIFEIEKQILKSKTNSLGEIKAKKRLYIAIYAFAYLIHLIMSNKGRKGDDEVTFKNFTPRGEKNVIVDLIKHSLDIIISAKNVTIREIPGMSPDIIKNSLIEAYKSIQSGGDQIIVHAGDAEDLLTTLLLDPVYQYYYNINMMDEVLNGRRKVPKIDKFDAVDSIDQVMGDSIAKLEKSKDIFAKAKIPAMRKWGVEKFDNIQPMKGVGRKSTWGDAHPGYVARSFELFAEKIRSRLYTEPMYVDVSADSKSRDLMSDVKFREPHEVFYAKSEKFLELESKLLRYRTMEYMQAYKMLPADKTRRWTNRNTSLGRLFDENGVGHKWNIYIVGDPAKEITVSDISSGTESGTRFTDAIVDRKCSICGTLWSAAAALSESKILSSLQSRNDVINFFKFYEYRCPVEGLHEFGEINSPCTKCGIMSSYSENSFSDAAGKYYKKYADAFTQERNVLAAVGSAIIYKAKSARDVSRFAEEYASWTFNFNIALDLASKIKINHRLISSLGAVEKQDYADVQSGKYIPSEVDDRYGTRIYVVDSYIKNLLTEYNQLRFFHRAVKPSISLSSLIDNSGISKHKIVDLSKKLPDMLGEYNDRFLYVQQHLKPRDIVNFCIQSYCEKCLAIWSDTDEETKTLRQEFVKYIVGKTLRFEELVSKPGYFNWSLLYGDKEPKERVDPNYDDSRGTRMNSIDDGEEGEDAGTTDTPMSTDAFDMEGDDGEDGAEIEIADTYVDT